MKNTLKKISSIAAGTVFFVSLIGLTGKVHAITLFHDDGTGPNPWTVIGGSPQDLMRGVRVGDIPSLFPVFSGTQSEADFLNSDIDQDAEGILIRGGGFSSSGDSAISSPLRIRTSFTDPVLPDANFNFELSINTPAFPNLALWISKLSVEYDPDPEEGEGNLWIQWGEMVEFINFEVTANVPGRGIWIQRTNAVIGGEIVRQRDLRRIDNYIRRGDISVVPPLKIQDQPSVEDHVPTEPDSLTGTVNLGLELIDMDAVPEPTLILGAISTLFTGLFLRKRANSYKR